MLIRATVENYRSFEDRAEFTMVSFSKIRRHAEHITRVGEAKVLRFAAIYGANAAGKSNLVDAIGFVQKSLQHGIPLSCTNRYCRHSPANRERESSFELQFSIGEEVFAYGFSALLSKRRITEEWLYNLGHSSAKCLLMRDTHRSISTSLDLTDSDRRRFETYAQDFADNEDSLFLTELNRSKRFEGSSPLHVYKDVYDWLTARLVVLAPMEPSPGIGYLFDDDALRRVTELIQSFDTGVSAVIPKELEVDELNKAVHPLVLRQLVADVQSALAQSGMTKISSAIRGDDRMIAIEFRSDGSYQAKEICLRHEGSDSIFDYGEESDGTRRLLDIASVLIDVREDVTFVMDELERSLHPMLVRRFLQIFAEKAARTRGQLVFTTHEASIMDQDLLRRDEYWFVDRSDAGTSQLYSLDRFKERFDKDIGRAYLDGRYGAVPAFGEFANEAGGA